MNANTIREQVANFLKTVNPSEGRITVVLNVFDQTLKAAKSFSIGRKLRPGRVVTGLTSAAYDSDPLTVAERLIADMS